MKKFNSKSPEVFSFLFALIFGFLVHGFIFYNYLQVGTDALIVSTQGWDWALQQGRWFQIFIDYVSGIYSSNHLNSIISVVYYAFSVFLIVRLLKLNKFSGCLVGAIVLTLPFLPVAFLYPNLADCFAGGFLLAVASVYILEKKNIFLASFLLCLSVATYQAFVAVAAGLCMVVVIIDYSKNLNFKKMINKILRCIMFGLLGLGLYYISVHIVENFVPIAARQNFGDAFNLKFNFTKEIIKNWIKIPILYSVFGENYVLSDFQALSLWDYVLPVTNSIIIIWAFFTILKKKAVSQKLVTTVLLIMLVLACGVVMAFNPAGIHSLMFWGVVALPILVIKLLDGADHKLNNKLIASFIILNVFSNLIFANQVYLHVYAGHEMGKDYLTTLQYDIFHSEGYAIDKTIVLCVNHSGNPYISKNPIVLPKNYPFVGEANFSGFYDMRLQLADFSWLPNEIALADRWYEWELNAANAEVVRSLPIYPEAGSIMANDKYIFVKLSDVDL